MPKQFKTYICEAKTDAEAYAGTLQTQKWDVVGPSLFDALSVVTKYKDKKPTTAPDANMWVVTGTKHDDPAPKGK